MDPDTIANYSLVKSGLDVLESIDFSPLSRANVGLVLNQASINHHLELATDVFKKTDRFSVKALFGPQHGLYGTTQANMIEWNTTHEDHLNLPLYSLYGEQRKPSKEMLKDVDTLVVDLPDIGARYYTYLWTAKLCMEACAENNLRMLVLDRPNPLSGILTEGPMLDKNHRTFVGLYELPTRHGMTIGEILTMMNIEEKIGCNLDVIRMEGWNRTMWFDETGLPWVMPSPNMPTLDTAMVYPGFCLLEATNISEGRGTTRPFELCGAPFIEAHRIVETMQSFNLPGVLFRPTYFVPTFDKYQGETCGGFQMHVLDRDAFKPVRTAAAFLLAVRMLYGEKLRWTDPPYEYEYKKMPIDILWGNPKLRELIDSKPEPETLGLIDAAMAEGMAKFGALREKYLMY